MLKCNKEQLFLALDPDIFPSQVVVSLGEWDSKRLVEFISEVSGTDVPSEAFPTPPSDGVCFQCDGCAVIWVSEMPTSAEAIALIAHECLHATFHCLKDLGLKPSGDSEESYTYFLQYLIGSILVNYKQYEEEMIEAEKPKRKRAKKKTAKKAAKRK